MGRREDIRIEEPSEGWGLLEFVDGFRAQINGATVETKDGKDYVNYYLYPFEDLKKRYEIMNEQLDSQGCMNRVFLRDMIITLNEDDPARKLKFCLLTFNGKETPATRMFKGLAQIRQIQELRDKLEQLRVQKACLKEENLLLKTNMPKYIKMHFSALAGDLLPLIQASQGDDQTERATNVERR